MVAPILQMTGIRKVFPGVVALDNVDFDLLPGEVHAIVGENGAGKSTLIKIISGLYRRDGGVMRLDGQEVDFTGPTAAVEVGIKTVYQELDLVPSLSVAENVYLGHYPRRRLGTVDWQKLHADTATLVGSLGLDIDPMTPVAHLKVSEQQLVEIARALSRQVRIVIMDEPTSALSPAEVEKLFGSIQCLKEAQVGVVYISHKLDEVYRIADRVTVFRDGQRIITCPVNDTRPQELVTMMVGRELKDYYPKTAAAIGAPRLEVRNVSAGRVQDLNLTVRQGEVVGIFGLLGAGNHHVGRALFGDAGRSGQVLVDGQLVRPASPLDAIRKGMGLLTEDRRADGIVPLLPVRSNLTLASLRQLSTGGWVWHNREAEVAADFVNRLDIKTPSLEQPIRFLSGGNQQKVLMGRWLLLDPKVLILSEPTRGIDVGAKAEIYRLIDEMAHRGISVLVLSTEMQEVLGICDRIVVMYNGRVSGEFARGQANEEALLAAATGVQEAPSGVSGDTL